MARIKLSKEAAMKAITYSNDVVTFSPKFTPNHIDTSIII